MDNNFEFQLSERVPKDYVPAIDTASLLVCNGFSTQVELLGQVDECADCALKSLINEPIEPRHSVAFALSSVYAYRLELRHYKQSSSISNLTFLPSHEQCRMHLRLEEYGKYVWNAGRHPNCGGLLPSSDRLLCVWREVKAGSSSMTPLVVLLGAMLLCLPFLFLLARGLLRAVAIWSPETYSTMCSVACFLADPRTSSTAAGRNGTAVKESDSQKGRVRVVSVDVLRGAAIVVMIFWAYGSGGYACLHHAIWDGIHLSDCALPCFVFVMGVSIAITNCRDSRRIREAIDARSDAKEGKIISNYEQLKQAILEFVKLVYRFSWRSLLLFLIGVSLSNSDFSEAEDFASIRILGVLQRLSLTYLFTSLATLTVFLRYEPQFNAAADSGSALFSGLFWDLTRFWPEWIPILAFVALQTGLEYGIEPANWNATSVASMTGCPRGYLGPGGLHWNSSFSKCTGGAHRLIDLYFVGDEHLDDYPTPSMVYEAPVPFEKNGLLGTCSSVLLCFLGLQAGKVLLFSNSDRERFIRWTVWAAFYGLLTLSFVLLPSPYPFNPSLLPINYNLWYFSSHQ